MSKVVDMGAAITLLLSEVSVEEKVEGVDLYFSREKCEPEVAYIKSIQEQLKEGHVYHATYLTEPGKYSRMPTNGIILMDVIDNEERFLEHEDKFMEAERLEIECAPLLHQGRVSMRSLPEFLSYESVLGGRGVAGVVLKYGPSGEIGQLDRPRFSPQGMKQMERMMQGDGDGREMNEVEEPLEGADAI